MPRSSPHERHFVASWVLVGGQSSSSWRMAPGLHVRGPTHGVLDDSAKVNWSSWVSASGVQEPTVLAVNLEGRFATPAALMELVVPLAKSVSGGAYGQLVLVFCTPDIATKTVLKALAEVNDARFFIADSVDTLREAEAAGRLTAGEQETLEMLHSLGGRTTVSVFAAEASLEASAAHNRLMSVADKGLVQWQDRSRKAGRLFYDPRAAIPKEDPADPNSADFDVPEPVRNDLRALAEAQGREPGTLYAEAVADFLDRNKEFLKDEHARIRHALADDDPEAMKDTARRFAKKQADARAREIRRRVQETEGTD